VKKSVNNRFTTDFGLFGLKNYTKNMLCCQKKNNFIYFDNEMKNDKTKNRFLVIAQA
jgi:hypothetical protein